MIVSLTAYSRPECLRRTLLSFATARAELDEPTFLVVRIDPSDQTDDIVSLVKQFADFYDVNEKRLGLQANTYAVLEESFEFANNIGEDFVVHAESDRLVAPDGLKLAKWMRDHFRYDPKVIFTTLKGGLLPPPSHYFLVALQDWFTTGWFGQWESTWLEHVSPQWDHDDFDSFDWNICRNVQGWTGDPGTGQFHKENDIELLQAHPYLSRTFHLWEEGVHSAHFTSGRGDPSRENGPYAGDLNLPDEEYHLNVGSGTSPFTK